MLSLKSNIIYNYVKFSFEQNILLDLVLAKSFC